MALLQRADDVSELSVSDFEEDKDAIEALDREELEVVEQCAEMRSRSRPPPVVATWSVGQRQPTIVLRRRITDSSKSSFGSPG